MADCIECINCPEGEEVYGEICRPTYETLERLLKQERTSKDELFKECQEEYRRAKSYNSRLFEENEKLEKEIADLRGFKNIVLSQFKDRGLVEEL